MWINLTEYKKNKYEVYFDFDRSYNLDYDYCFSYTKEEDIVCSSIGAETKYSFWGKRYYICG